MIYICLQTEYLFSVSETDSIGTSIGRLETIEPSKSIVYDIVSGDDLTVLDVHPHTGGLILKRSLDYEMKPEYRFVVRAQDSTAMEKTWSLAAVHMKLKDENDNQPTFPLALYVEFIGENEPVGSTVFTAAAVDLDNGAFGKLNYSILEGDGKDKFHIDSTTGVVTTSTVFDYEMKNQYYFILRANDIGGYFSTVKVEVHIESKDEFPPQFTSRNYQFVIPSNAAPGHVIGHVEAIDQDKGADGLVFYDLKEAQHNFFRVNHSNGAISLSQPLSSVFNASSVVVEASSGREGSERTSVVVDMWIGAPSEELEIASSSNVADWVVGLLVISLLLLFLCCTVFVVLHLRHKKQSKNGKSESYNNVGFDALDYAHQSTMLAGNSRPTSIYSPQYSDLADLQGVVGDRRRVNNMGSELSDKSHSASSGRGSAEDGEEGEDEEIRMINERSLAQQKLRDSIGIPDSGIHGDDDNLSQSSAKNTQEYLARLGIRPKLSEDILQQSAKNNNNNSSNTTISHGEWTPSGAPDSLDHVMMFEEDGSGVIDGNGLDISTLIYSQIPEDVNDMEGISSHHGHHEPHRNAVHHTQPSMNGSLSSIIHSEEELTGSYNWDYLLDWGPQYQPLAHVFSEIARLRDDSSANGSENHYSGISSRNSVSNQSRDKSSCAGIGPHVINTGSPASRTYSGGSGTNNMNGNSRPGPLPPLPVMPRSPISQDNNFASGPMSPSFSPALSPLANRSPPISPLGGVGVNSKNMIRTSQYHQNYSSSESEMRI